MNRNQHTLPTFPSRPDIADDPWVARFVVSLRNVRHASPHTVANYLRDLGQFARFHWGKEAPLPLDWATPDRDAAQRFLHAYARTGAKPTSTSRKLAALRVFYRFLLRAEAVKVSPFATLRPPRRAIPHAFHRGDPMKFLKTHTGAMAVLAGLVIDRYRSRGLQLAGMIVGTAVCYAFGTAWFCFIMDSTPMAALSLCVIPFIPGDLVKMALAMWVGPLIRGRLAKAGLDLN